MLSSGHMIKANHELTHLASSVAGMLLRSAWAWWPVLSNQSFTDIKMGLGQHNAWESAQSFAIAATLLMKESAWRYIWKCISFLEPSGLTTSHHHHYGGKIFQKAFFWYGCIMLESSSLDIPLMLDWWDTYTFQQEYFACHSILPRAMIIFCEYICWILI